MIFGSRISETVTHYNQEVVDLVMAGKLISQQPRRIGVLTPISGRQVEAGKMYIWNGHDNTIQGPIDTRTRWQHFFDWLRIKLRRHAK